jgi:acylphosphatase
MQIRAKIIVKGEIQRVGYRDAVEKIARKLDINGFVENLKPYDVRIVCEGEEGNITRFLGALKIEGDPFISVSDIAVEYEKPTGEFPYFEIKRGSTEEETGERLDLAALHLKNLTSAVSMMNTNIGGKIDNLDEHLGGKIDNLDEHLGGKIDNLGEKIDAGRGENREGFAILGEKIDAGRGENREGFAILGEKIDGIKEDTGEMTDTLSFLKAVYRETLELKEKYEVLSRDVAEIKVKLKAG